MKYRPDIDGLRAIAVLSVVAFHIGVPFLSGGFVGVDIFFVISGYLITGHLVTDMRTHSFAVRLFYERRVRRIAPALLVMLLVALITACFTMFPSELVAFVDSAIATVLSASNVYFWHHAGYFTPLAVTKPLLHTWSLGVEEQFYVAFPLLLLGLRRSKPSARISVLLGLAIASFATSLVETYLVPTAAFYLPESRAWELLLGALLALGAVPIPVTSHWRNLGSVVGLMLIVGAVTLLSRSTPFPGLAALAPTLGALLVLYAGQNGPSWAGRILSLGPLRFVGLISYSLYLWHWPLIVFQQLYPVGLLERLWPPLVSALVLLASLVLATLSWRFVERPFRDRRSMSTPSLLKTVGALAALVLAVSAGLAATQGLPQRYPARVVTAASFLTYDFAPIYRYGECYLGSGATTVTDFDRARCLTPGRGRNFLLIGDSHAADLWYGLNGEAGAVHLLQANASGCKPLLPLTGDRDCVAFMLPVFQSLLGWKRLDGLIVSAEWTRHDLRSLETTMSWWHTHHIPAIVIGPKPVYDMALPRLIAWSLLRNDEDLPQRHLILGNRALDDEMAQLAARKGIRYISLFQILCEDSRCPVWTGAEPLEFDSHHFTRGGSILAARALARAGIYR